MIQDENDISLADSLKGLALIPALVEEVKEIKKALAALQANPHSSKSRYLTLVEAAQELNLSQKTVRRLIGRGFLHKCGNIRHIRVPVEEIEDYKRRSV